MFPRDVWPRYTILIQDLGTKILTQTCRGEIPEQATMGPMCEYTCHEGNYCPRGVLAGLRPTRGR